jgi:hypothetical protein
MRHFWPYRTGAMQDRGYELPRIPILGTWVNKAFIRAYASSHSTVFSTFCASGRTFSNISDSE